MSIEWTPHCMTCSENGPELRSGASLKEPVGERYEQIGLAGPLKAFLDEHVWHNVVLLCGLQEP